MAAEITALQNPGMHVAVVVANNLVCDKVSFGTLCKRAAQMAAGGIITLDMKHNPPATAYL